MPIHDQSYRHWEGTLKTHSFRWWTITKEGLRILLRRKLFLLFILGPPAILFFAYGAIVYGLNVYGDIFRFKVVDGRFFFTFLMMQNFFIVLICIFGGSGLIANDLRNDALQLYLSKPLTRLDYLAGKFMIVLILLGFVTLVPGILLFLEHAVLSKGATFIRENYWLLGSILLHSLILTVPTGLLILALSSATKSSRYAAIIFIAILMGSPMLSGILSGILKLEMAAFVSYWSNLEILGRRLFGVAGSHSWYWAALVIMGIIGFSIWTMIRNVRGVDIVK